MTDSRRVAYIRDQLSRHISLFFSPEASRLFRGGLVEFLTYEECCRTHEPKIAIPHDVELPKVPEVPYRVEFNDTELTLFNRLPRPTEGSWTAIPNDLSPLWYRNPHGTLIPSWNIFGNLYDLLTFGEELRYTGRDRHGRFAAAFSPRTSGGLLEVPAVNEAAAAIVAGLSGLTKSDPQLDLKGLLKSVAVVLSHDCDIMYGNDILTQAVRAIRVVLPLGRLRPPKIDNLWWIIRNAVSPRRFYLRNAIGMIDLERCFGYTSAYYMLNGNGGRYGARSKPESIVEFAPRVPEGWDVGMHYNYDTFLDDDKFAAQQRHLESLLGKELVSGRAHYLKFDPHRSFPFLRKHGIVVDESSGFADRIGYRNGIAGCFEAYDPAANESHGVLEVPLTIMDAVLIRQYGSEAMRKFAQLLHHLSRIGGALSVVFHPGMFFNPEYRHLLGMYHMMLIECRRIGAVSRTARSLAADWYS